MDLSEYMGCHFSLKQSYRPVLCICSSCVCIVTLAIVLRRCESMDLPWKAVSLKVDCGWAISADLGKKEKRRSQQFLCTERTDSLCVGREERS